MRTQTYRGTLIDAACARGGSGTSTTSSTSSSTDTTTSSGTSTTSGAGAAGSDRSARTTRSGSTQNENTTAQSESAASSTAADRQAGRTTTAGSADRSTQAGSACPVTASTTQFALKTKDGQTVVFDSVGNERAREALKNKKKWSQAAESGKDIKVKVSGAMSGEKLTVMSIN